MRRIEPLLMAGLLCVLLIETGCRTFNYTEADLERERRQIQETWRRVPGIPIVVPRKDPPTRPFRSK